MSLNFIVTSQPRRTKPPRLACSASTEPLAETDALLDHAQCTSTDVHSSPSGFNLHRAIARWKERFSFFSKGPSPVATPRPMEILYSVFRAHPEITPLVRLLTGGFLDTGPTTKKDFRAVVCEAEAAILENTPLTRPELIYTGSSGSYFLHDRQGNITAVFKPQDEEPYGPLSPKITKWIHRRFFPCFFGRSCLIPNTGYLAESAASLLDRQLQTYIVPFTDTVEISSASFYYPFWERVRHSTSCRAKIGSFQLYLTGYKGAAEFFHRYPLPPGKNPTEGHSIWGTANLLERLRMQIEKLVILDFILRNTDRGPDNWMLKLDLSDSEHPIIKLGAIDSGLSFPWKHPNEWRSFPYGWLYLPLSIIGRPFSDETRRHFLPLLTSPRWWEDTTSLLREIFGRDPAFTEKVFCKQVEVLKGQAWNVVETLKRFDEGPLDLVRKTRVLVIDQEVQVPVGTPITTIANAMAPADDPSEQRNGRNKTSLQVASIQDNWNKFVSGQIDEECFEQGNSNILGTIAQSSNGINGSDYGTIGSTSTQLQNPFGDYNELPDVPRLSSSSQINLMIPGTKTVIIEKLQVVTARTPIFSCC